MTSFLIGAGAAISQYVDRVEMSDRFEGIESYNASDDFNDAVQEMKIKSNGEKTFVGLSSRFLYHIGIMTKDTEQIRVTITD